MFRKEVLLNAMKERHSVRSYKNRQIEGETKEKLEAYIEACNKEGGLHIQLVLNEPKAFANFLCHYGMFSGVKNYIALIGEDDSSLEEKCGYYGEKIVLAAQALGLNTCWVGATYKKIKSAFEVNKGEKLLMVIAIGYGENSGFQHKNKSLDKLCKMDINAPEWFKNGMEAVLMAPTAINQQKFYFSHEGNVVTATAVKGPYSTVDLGIAKCHFELGAGIENFVWRD